ncbi:14706_t:CDS:2, partial [Gigaspora rosea]
IIDNFENKILCQFPCVPCSICSKLMYPGKSMWIQRDPNVVYPLTVAYPNISLTTNPVPPSNRIAICHSCKSKPNRNYPQYLFPIPIEIELVPLEKLLEPELYQKVNTLQIHICNSKCGGPAPSNLRCRKGFPHPYAEHTYYNPNNFRYTYQCERITNSSIQVQFLTTDPPNIRTKAILPLYMINFFDDNPYWSDKIEKYFARPNNPEFDN